MSNGEVCCILGLCCPPAAARTALVKELVKASGAETAYAEKCADYVLEHFDLAPHGSLQAFKDYAVTHLGKHKETS